MTKNDYKMYYFNTDTDIRLGDKITYRKLLGCKKKLGTVVYVPGESPVNKNMEYGDVKLWGFILDDDPNTLFTMGYFPREEKYAHKRINFVSRGDTQGIRGDEAIK